MGGRLSDCVRDGVGCSPHMYALAERVECPQNLYVSQAGEPRRVVRALHVP